MISFYWGGYSHVVNLFKTISLKTYQITAKYCCLVGNGPHFIKIPSRVVLGSESWVSYVSLNHGVCLAIKIGFDMSPGCCEKNCPGMDKRLTIALGLYTLRLGTSYI